MLSTAKCDLSDEHYDVISEAIQCECIAFMARGNAFKKFGGKKKHFPKKKFSGKVMKTGMSVDDRRKKLKEIKSRSTCKSCGKRGHWAGDQECQKAGASGGRAFLSIMDDDKDEKAEEMTR